MQKNLSMKIQNILITGSGGFIGKNLKEYFENEYKILAPRSFELDLTNKVAVEKYFKENKIDLIIHLATVGGIRGTNDCPSTYEDNLNMFKNLVQARENNAKIITFGSGAMYDKTKNLHKVKESEIGQFEPKDLYGKSKIELAKIVEKTENALCFNIFACYGKYEKETRFPTYAILQNLKNKEIIIENNSVFDYLFIEDLEKIIEHFVKNWSDKKIINLTPTKSTTMAEIAEIINKIGKHKTEIKILNSIQGKEYTGSNSLLLEEMPDFKFTELETGLKKLFEHIEKTKN